MSWSGAKAPNTALPAVATHRKESGPGEDKGCVISQLREPVAAVQLLTHIQIFCNPTDYSPPDSSFHGISQTRTLEWVAVSYSSQSSQLRG